MRRKHPDDDLRRHISILETELASCRHYNETIEQLLLESASMLGVQFFESMVIDLARHLQADCTLIGELVGNPKTISGQSPCASMVGSATTLTTIFPVRPVRRL
jgi:hypothetical protein